MQGLRSLRGSLPCKMHQDGGNQMKWVVLVIGIVLLISAIYLAINTSKDVSNWAYSGETAKYKLFGKEASQAEYDALFGVQLVLFVLALVFIVWFALMGKRVKAVGKKAKTG